MIATLISDLYENDTFNPKDVLDELFDYMSEDLRLKYIWHFSRTHDIDLGNWSITDKIDPVIVLEDATDYFSTSFQKGFINRMYELYE